MSLLSDDDFDQVLDRMSRLTDDPQLSRTAAKELNRRLSRMRLPLPLRTRSRRDKWPTAAPSRFSDGRRTQWTY